jgi:hypothetical protein
MSIIVAKSRIVIWLAWILILSGCAGVWQTAPHEFQVHRWEIAPPDGWMHMSTADSEMFSKDGPYLEYILVQSRPLEKKFHFSGQRLNPNMLPHEAARLITDTMRFDPRIRQFRLLSSKPAMVGGHPGFRLTYTYQDQNGVDLKTIHYGTVLPDAYFNLRYTATQRHYFDSELPAFNKVFDSLRLVSG